jgi:hypothetical protein
MYKDILWTILNQFSYAKSTLIGPIVAASILLFLVLVTIWRLRIYIEDDDNIINDPNKLQKYFLLFQVIGELKENNSGLL